MSTDCRLQRLAIHCARAWLVSGWSPTLFPGKVHDPLEPWIEKLRREATRRSILQHLYACRSKTVVVASH